ncbi:MAG: BMP family ABC transporter substrate-binding protein, partial [Rhodobacteraceae bacterium]|nr:BMP family ABC transporter substrate-binding protein [Paracoccaceae bacterium]
DALHRHSRRNFLAGTLSLAGTCAGWRTTAQSALLPSPRIAGLFTAPTAQLWVSRVHHALVHANERGDIEYNLWQNVLSTEYTDVFREVSRQQYDLIIGDCFAVEDLIRELILEYPNNAYLMGSARLPETSHEKFCVFEHHIQDASYLTGLVAGAISRRGLIGIVASYPSPDTNRLVNAYIAGARDMNPAIEHRINYLHSWHDPQLAREMTMAQIDEGADVLYAERVGVAETARIRRVLSIGTLVDRTPQFPRSMVTAAIWNFGPTLWAAINRIAAGTYSSRNMWQYSGLAHFGCEIAPLRQFRTLLNSDQLEHVARREFEIRNAVFKIPRVETAPHT